MPSSLLCPSCRKLISADEEVCPYCGLRRPAARWKKGLFTLFRLDAETTVRDIIYLNVALYAISLALMPTRLGMSANPFALLSPSDQSLLLLGATGKLPISGFHRWWSLLSANYLHGSLLHIFFNMAALWQIGPLVVQEYGVNRMVVLYTLSGVVGFLVSYLAGVVLTIGASAAICGLIGAGLYYGKSRGGTYGQALYQRLLGWAVGIFLFGFVAQGINNWAHAGGMGAGFLLAMALGYQDRGREVQAHRWAAAVCVVATLAVLLWALGTAAAYRLLG
jgi:rhomboid protease GluP